MAASLPADRMRLKPSGPFYAIFALGARASVPTTVPLWLAMGICAGSAAFSMLIGVAGSLRNRTWSLLPGFDRTTLTVLLMGLLFPTEPFMMRHYGLAVMFFTPAILLMSQLASPSSRHVLITDRGLETLIGASIGMAGAVFIREPGRPSAPARG